MLIALLAVGAALLWRGLHAGPTPPVRAADAGVYPALQAWLEHHEGLIAAPDQLRLLTDPAERTWTEANAWIPALALAHPPAVEGGIELDDLYCFEVRLAADGTPVALRRLTNITASPSAQERLLAVQGEHALLGVQVDGKVASLVAVDLGGDERVIPQDAPRGERLRARITRLQETGRAEGVGLRLYRVDPPALRAEASVSGLDPAFQVRLLDEGDVAQRWSVPFAAPETPRPLDEAAPPERLAFQPRFYAPKMFTPWLVDTVRNLSFVGPEKIAALEHYVFQWVDRGKQGAFAVGLVDEQGKLQEELGEDVVAHAPTLDTSGAGFDAEWPPPPIPSGVPDPAPGEGRWSPAQPEWLRTLEGAPPAFMKTAVRMDPKRPYQIVVLIAMDMRQLDLGAVAGTQTPESSFGTPGDGLLPRRPEVANRFVAAFNGGFKTAHGAFGMSVDHQIVLPAMPFAATVAVEDDGQVLMGAWNNSMTIPEDIKTFRQNLPPLIADGKLNPTGKRQWGGTASDLDSVHTERSGVCFRGRNTLIYAWGQGMSADSLGQAMIAAGCEFGMHLDMNPTHTGWTFYRVDTADLDDKGRFTKFEMEKGGKTMDFRADRYIERDVKDFFYLTLRQPLADLLPAPPQGFSPWSAQHAPPGQEGFLPLTATSTGPRGERLAAVDLNRLTAQLQRGAREPNPQRAPVEPARLTAPALLLDLGLTTPEDPAGLLQGDLTAAPRVPGQGALVLRADGRLALLGPAQVDALPQGEARALRGGHALLVDGQLQTPPPRAGSGVRHVVATDAQGRLLLLSADDTPERLASTLQGLGAKHALLLASSLHKTPSPLTALHVRDGQLAEVDLYEGRDRPLTPSRAESTLLYLERAQEPPRVRRLDLPEVQLSEEESRRQKKLLAQITAMREELRNVENAKYREWVEKLKAKREGKTP